MSFLFFLCCDLLSLPLLLVDLPVYDGFELAGMDGLLPAAAAACKVSEALASPKISLSMISYHLSILFPKL
jgi:hypothetical protein